MLFAVSPSTCQLDFNCHLGFSFGQFQPQLGCVECGLDFCAVPPRSIVRPPETLTERMQELDKRSKIDTRMAGKLANGCKGHRGAAGYCCCLNHLFGTLVAGILSNGADLGGGREEPLSQGAHPTLPPRTAALTDRWRSRLNCISDRGVAAGA
eukprot:2406790-Amphidinium_carterae.1